MTDDVIDYRSDKETMGKNPCKDIQEGKLTLPLIAALRKAHDAEKVRVATMIREKQMSDDDQEWVRAFVESRGGIKETLETSRTYLEKGGEYLQIFQDSEEKRAP